MKNIEIKPEWIEAWFRLAGEQGAFIEWCEDRDVYQIRGQFDWTDLADYLGEQLKNGGTNE